MAHRDIVVLGASAGGVGAFRTVLRGLLIEKAPAENVPQEEPPAT